MCTWNSEKFVSPSFPSVSVHTWKSEGSFSQPISSLMFFERWEFFSQLSPTTVSVPGTERVPSQSPSVLNRESSISDSLSISTKIERVPVLRRFRQVSVHGTGRVPFHNTFPSVSVPGTARVPFLNRFPKNGIQFWPPAGRHVTYLAIIDEFPTGWTAVQKCLPTPKILFKGSIVNGMLFIWI